MRAKRLVILTLTVVAAFAWTGTGLPGPVPANAAVAASSAVIPKPQASGHLAIAGRLRDGDTVYAAGVRWRPGSLPPSDKLLSFEVSYTWRACRGKCVTAADTTATPFAAGRYVVGHADTGARLRLTETATEVVETDPATFSFSVVHAAATYTTAASVEPYPAGRPPTTEYVNGTPERRTASDQEYFQVDPPHYNAHDGPVRQQYRLDGGTWRGLPASRLVYTGTLAVGAHQVQIRTSDSAGSTIVGFGWRVTPMTAPVACSARPRGTCWYPPHLNSRGKPTRWDWQIGRVTPLERTGARAVDVYDVDGFLTTAGQVHAIHTTWQAATLPHPKLICYIDMAWEDYRPDASPGQVFPANTLGDVYYGYPEERWLDFRQLDALKPMLDERLEMCANKGFDAVELDDIDSFDPPSTTGFHLTPGDAQNFLAYAYNEIHRLGMTGLWKNSPYLTWWARSYSDGAVVEECYLSSQCTAASFLGSKQYGITCTALGGGSPCGWDVFTADRTNAQPTGKWVGEAEYSADNYVCNPGQGCPPKRLFATFCREVYSPSWGFAAVKFDVNLDGKLFYPCPKGT
jgi:Glycoside-hydrolase family GH114